MQRAGRAAVAARDDRGIRRSEQLGHLLVGDEPEQRLDARVGAGALGDELCGRPVERQARDHEREVAAPRSREAVEQDVEVLVATHVPEREKDDRGLREAEGRTRLGAAAAWRDRRPRTSRAGPPSPCARPTAARCRPARPSSRRARPARAPRARARSPLPGRCRARRARADTPGGRSRGCGSAGRARRRGAARTARASATTPVRRDVPRGGSTPAASGSAAPRRRRVHAAASRPESARRSRADTRARRGASREDAGTGSAGWPAGTT